MPSIRIGIRFEIILKKTSEKINPNQLTISEIFNEPEALVDISIPEPKAEDVFTEVKGHVRKKTHLKDRLPDDIPVEEHHHSELKEGDCCPICGYQLVKFGSKQYEYIKIIPAKVVLIETCKVSDINPYEYLVFALKEAPGLYESGKEDEIKYLTPAYYPESKFLTERSSHKIQESKRRCFI